MNKQAISNSTCIIALERIGQLNLLRQLFNELLVPPAVYSEFGIPTDWLIIKPVSDTKLVTALETQLDKGEAEAIALAMEHDNVYIILDDKKARRVAKQMGLRVIGTLGILLRAKREGLIKEIKPLLNSLKQVDFYMTDALYQESLRIAGESNSQYLPY